MCVIDDWRGVIFFVVAEQLKIVRKIFTAPESFKS